MFMLSTMTKQNSKKNKQLTHYIDQDSARLLHPFFSLGFELDRGGSNGKGVTYGMTHFGDFHVGLGLRESVPKSNTASVTW